MLNKNKKLYIIYIGIFILISCLYTYYTNSINETFNNKGETIYPPDSIQTYISNVIYINLDKRTDRKAEIEKELTVFNPEKIQRISAVADAEYPYVGCTKSHLKALKIARENDWDNVLILEDDAIWADIENAYPVFEKLVQQPFDVIMLGGTFAKYNHSTYRIKKAQSSASYLVNKSYYNTLIANIEGSIRNFKPRVTTESEFAIDLAVFGPLQAKDNWFIVAPALMIQSPSHSDIVKKHVDYTNLFAK